VKLWSLKHWLIYSAIGIASCLLPYQSSAQGTDVGVSGGALVSVQSTDDTYQSPYLDQPIGGVGPGFGAGISMITERGFVAIGEFTTARYELEQQGRVVPNCSRIPRSFECTATTTKLHDSLVTGLVGYAFSAGRTKTLLLGGVSSLVDSATTNGLSIHGDESVNRGIGFTGGLGALVSLSPRVSIDVGARYTFIERSDREIEIGAGSSIFRVLGGIRVRLN
jgi:opacity protein-like surface antigen